MTIDDPEAREKPPGGPLVGRPAASLLVISQPLVVGNWPFTVVSAIALAMLDCPNPFTIPSLRKDIVGRAPLPRCWISPSLHSSFKSR